MKHEIEVCSQCGLAMVRLVGTVDGDGLYEVLDALVEDKGWDPGQSDLWDLRALSDLFIAPAQVAKLTDHMPPAKCARSDGRTALVTRTLTQRAYGNLFFDAINPPSRVHRSFHSKRRAARWLLNQAGRAVEIGACGQNCLMAEEGRANFVRE